MPTSITLHGVFLQVFDLGVLLTGPSGIGKSELALGLINRGHRFIADDSIEIIKNHQNHLIGKSSAILRDFLEVRGLGILNIRGMFGDKKIKQEQHLQFIIKLAHFSRKQLQHIDRLAGLRSYKKILNVEIPVVTMPVITGRNLAVLVEAAVLDQKLKNVGYDAREDIINRQYDRINSET